MRALSSPDVIVYVCVNALPQGGHLPRQWEQDGARVLACEVPCTGKMDGQYLMHAMEGGANGFCVVACPRGKCRLGQGNYRAEVRVQTIRRLLAEAGLPAERAQLLHVLPEESFIQLEGRVRAFVGQLCALGTSPLRADGVPQA
jgi:coenzyme F420-reducing hydrogenase delta subunit